jgi:hypothetical protein
LTEVSKRANSVSIEKFERSSVNALQNLRSK